MIRTEQLADKGVRVPGHSCERRESRAAVLSQAGALRQPQRAERAMKHSVRRFSSASDDEVGGFLARLREQLRKGPGNTIGTRLLCFSHRKPQLHTGIPGRLGIGEHDRSARTCDEFTNDGQTEARTARVPPARIIESCEALKDPLP